MKDASHILASLRRRPQFSKLAQQECIKRIRGLFPPRLQRLIRYGYFHNGILYFVLSHPGAKQEFDNITASIKAPLKQYSPPECTETPPADIRAFVTHTPPVREKPPAAEETAPAFPERSKGAFANPLTHPELHDLLEKIREHIHHRTR